MNYFDFIKKTDQLVRALSTCALLRQDAKFDYFSNKLDQLLDEYPEHYKTMMENRNKGIIYTAMMDAFNNQEQEV